MRRAVFLDRDGTLVDELGFLARAEDLRLLPGAAEAVRRLNAAGIAAIVVTNQSGIARGLFDEAALARVHARLAQELARGGARASTTCCTVRTIRARASRRYAPCVCAASRRPGSCSRPRAATGSSSRTRG